ncbi:MULTISPECIES: Uma2 family endonuclease [unclassified Roseofilum]|uniref:Uma2 family endonuclease n=1 Tax=unclassified Roseofilum TaxID=2620099 RepID=UPI000E9A9798|nr:MULTISPECIES: Uma2 family endonuclease [unclassified Roseofilum]HBR00601.1 hypothetical protein [Cyanobacteria bacterium UBA11691]
MTQLYPYPKQQSLPTMYDLPSEDPEEPGLPDEFHDYQPDLLTQTCQSPRYSQDNYVIASDLNLYYDSDHTLWYKRPDWFVVLGAKRSRNQQELRLSYVIWQEEVSPFLVIELASPGTEDEDLGRTERKEKKPPTKWEVYEQILQIPYYVIYDRYQNQLRVFVLNSGRYERLELSQGKVWLEQLGLGLRLWQGVYEGVEGRWLRFYDRDGEWIPTPSEQAEQERQRANREQQRANREQQRAEETELELQRLRDKLQQLNIDPDSV